MSTGPRTEAAFIQNNQSKVEHNDSHSALFYLVHEVSKLATPIHGSLFDTNPPSKKLNEASTRNASITEEKDKAATCPVKDPLTVKAVDEHLFQSSSSSHRHSLYGMIPYNCMKNVIEEGHASNASTLCDPHGEWNSPWKVLSLINLHCEKLLHPKDVVEPDFSLESSSSRVSHLNPTFVTTMPDVTEGTITEDGLESTSGPSLQLCVSQLSSSSTYMECINVPKPGLMLDHNANITLPAKQPFSTQLPPMRADLLSLKPGSLMPNTAGSPSNSGHFDKPANEENHPAADFLTASECHLSSVTSPEIRTVSNGEKDQLSTSTYKAKTRRKQPHPSRSADSQDPDFQGVTFRIDTQLDDSKQQCRLLITSKYSKDLSKSMRKPKMRKRRLQKLAKTSSSDEESDLTTNIYKGKVCASCCTKKTPMWRDAEDGTPLCNACGIRYKKYRVRCVKCWHIPRKEGNSSSLCSRCGSLVRLTSGQRKHSS